MNTNKSIISNNKSNIFDLTFNINSLPTYLIRKVLSYYYNHCLSMYKYIQKTSKQFTGYKLKFRWMDLCLVCKFWMENVMPFLPNTFYFMDSQQKLETYLNLAEYGGTFPRRFLRHTVLRVTEPPANIKKYPFHINNIGIFINRYQKPHPQQQDSIIPEFIYQQIFKISPDLKKLSFQTEKIRESDLYYLLKTINQLSLTCTPLLSALNLDRSIFTVSSFYQLCKILESPTCTITHLSLNNCKLSIDSLGPFKDEQQQVDSNEDNDDSTRTSFLNSMKMNKSIINLKMKQNNFFNASGSSLGSNYRFVIGGTILEFFKLIFVNSKKITHFEFTDSKIYLGELNKGYGQNVKVDYLTPMQSNLQQISLSCINIDGFLPFLGYSIQSSNNNSISNINLSHSVFSNYQPVNNLLTCLQHSQSLRTLNLSNTTFNIGNSSHHHNQGHHNHQPQAFNDEEDDEEDDDDNNNHDINSTNAFDNTVGGGSGVPNGWEKLGFLYGTQSLTSIDLSSISLNNGEDEMNNLFKSLLNSPQIKQFYLNRCGLNSSCLTNLTNFIRQKDSQLETLHLGKNQFGPSISLLLMAFQLNKSITDIDISYNGLSDMEGHHIANYLKSKVSQIRRFNISGSNFKLGGLNQIGHALMINKSLVSLALSNCPMGMLEVTYIFDGLVQHPTISLLDLTNVGSNEMISSLVKTSGLRCDVIY